MQNSQPGSPQAQAGQAQNPQADLNTWLANVQAITPAAVDVSSRATQNFVDAQRTMSERSDQGLRVSDVAKLFWSS